MVTPASKSLVKEPWGPKEIPPFPALAIRALNLVAGTDSSLLELCNLIRPDVAFSAEILRFSNSPLVAFPKSITNILQASMVLGFHRLRRVVVTVGLRSYLKNGFTPLLHACWRHSLACAMIAERIAPAIPRDKEVAFTAGVLHDIGRFTMAVSCPSLYDHLEDGEAGRAHNLLIHEREQLGMDHCQAGASLIQQWQLPEIFAEVAAHHHDLKPEPPDGIVSILALSCSLADALGFTLIPHETTHSYAEILSSFPRPLLEFPEEGNDLAAEIAESIQQIESM